MKQTNTWKFFDTILVLCSVGILLIFCVGLLLLPQREMSERENRMLRRWESSSWQSVLEGSFSDEVGSVVRDQFPMREAWVSLKARCEQMLGKRENNGVLLGADGYLMARNEYVELSVAERNLRSVEEFSKRVKGSLTQLWIPRSCDVMSKWLPEHYPSDAARRLFQMLNGTPQSFLQEAVAEGGEVYYKTDHHLTTEGAYLLYCWLGDQLGYVPRGRDSFSVETVSKEFFGSADSAVGGIASRADTVELYRYDGDDGFLVTNREMGSVRSGFYDWSALERKDQYSIFLGGNFAHLSVREVGVEKPCLLLIKDSFANALVPFLAIHFDLEIVDLRYVSGEIFVDSCDGMLILHGIDTLATDPSLGKIDWIQYKNG